MAIGRIPEPLAGVQESLFTTKGDLVVATGPSQVVRQGVGSNNQVLMADSVQSDGVKWANEATATLTAKGDILTATGANTIARLGVGANGTTLVADSAEATGLKWATPTSSSGLTLITTLSPSGVASSSADNVFTSTYDSYLIVGYITWTDNTNLEMRLRASGSDITTSTYFQDQTSAQGSAGSTWYLADNRGTNVITGFTIGLTNPGNSNYKIGNLQRTINATTGTYVVQGLRNSTLSVTDGIKFFPSSGTMTGTIRIYGLAK